MHSIVYDELHDEIVVPQPLNQSVMTFRGGAKGEEPPIRLIQGPLTQLVYPTKLTVDPVHNEIFVPVYAGNAVLVFPLEATGNVAPIRTIKGLASVPSARELAVDPVHNLFIVSGRLARGAEDTRPSVSFGPQKGDLGGEAGVVFFQRTAQGDFKPLGELSTGRGSIVALPAREEILVVESFGTAGSYTDSAEERLARVSIWSIHDRGNAPPRRRWMIQAPDDVLSISDDTTLDVKRKTLIVGGRNSMMTYFFPEIF
jgi:hypothetical protein